MPFLTMKELGLRPFQTASQVNDNLRRTVESSLKEERVFLFYRTADKERVISMVNLIKSMRVNVFVDYVELSVLEGPPHRAHEVIRERLYQSEKAILMATPQPISINGFPLDFGLNGKYQFTRKVAIFPITEQPQVWKEKDIYRVYGYIQKKYSLFNMSDDWQVIYPEGERVLLKEWLLT